MKASTAMMLARPASADRGRFLLVAAAAAVASGLLIGAASVARLNFDTAIGLYSSDSGMRPGVLVAVALLTIPTAAFTIQALRVGSVARDHRMAALRLAGATPHDVRVVAAAEAGAATAVGALFGGWIYALLWLVLGVLPPPDLRLLPTPDALDIAVWVAVAVLVTVGGAVAGAAIQQRVVAEPLGVFRRARRDGPGRASLVAVVAGPLMLIAGMIQLALDPLTLDPQSYSIIPWVLMIVGITVTALGAGPRLVRRSGRRLREREGVEALLAGWRLEADPQGAGRVAGVLLLCGAALGIEANFIPLWFGSEFKLSADQPGSFLIVLAGGATLAAVAVAVLTLLVGAADQLLDSRRSLATLAAMGVDEATLRRVLRRQLTSAARPAVLWGILVIGCLTALVGGLLSVSGGSVLFLFCTPCAALVGIGVVAGATRLAGRVLAPRLRAVIDPENLRVG